MAHLGTWSLLLSVDGSDFTDSVSRAVIVAKSSGRRGFGKPVEDRDYSLALTAAQDATGGLWALAWGRSGELLDFYLAPYGNETASVDQPHYAGTVIVDEPDGDFLGGSADPSRRKVMTVELAWPIVGRPQQITEGSYPALLPEGW